MCLERDFELPAKFQAYIARYPNCTVLLAHSRPLEDTLYMLKTYPSTVCDSAFTTNQYKKDIKLAKKRHYNIEELEKVVFKLANDIPLEEKYHDHALEVLILIYSKNKYTF